MITLWVVLQIPVSTLNRPPTGQNIFNEYITSTRCSISRPKGFFGFQAVRLDAQAAE